MNVPFPKPMSVLSGVLGVIAVVALSLNLVTVALAVGVTINGVNIDVQQQGSNGVNVQTNTGAGQQVMVNLGAGTDVLIKTDGDLQAYNRIVVQERPSIIDVSTDTGELVVAYRQPSKFLGLFGTHLRATVAVDANGVVQVHTPWYGFLFSKDTATVKRNVELNVRSANGNGQIQVQAVGSSGVDSVTVRNKAKVINVVTSSIDGNISGTPVASATPVSPMIPAPPMPIGTPAAAVSCQVPTEFPFAQYPSLLPIAVGINNGTVIASAVDSSAGSKASLVVTRGLDLKGSVTTAYVFDAFDTTTTSSAGTVYLAATARAELGGRIGNVVRLSKPDLIRKAMVAVGLLGAACNY